MQFVSTSTFQRSFNILTKRPENGYATCSKDICSELKNLSFDDIAAKHFRIRTLGNLNLMKIRIQNSGQSLSSSAGFRLILITNGKYEHIAFLEIYPKRGKYSKTDLTKTEYKNVLEEYLQEMKANRLTIHDIHKELEPISV